MRSATTIVMLACVGVWLECGCAQPKAAPMIAPTQAETPRFVEPEDVIPASVGVEGRHDEPRATLVPEIKAPELTAEERKALGEQPELINFLEFYRPLPIVMRIWPDMGGVSAGIHGMGGAGVQVEPYAPPSAMGGRSNPVQGIYSERSGGFGVGGRREAVAGNNASLGGVGVGINPARRVSGHVTHPER